MLGVKPMMESKPYPYRAIVVGKRIVMEHLYKAELALGKRLPKGAVVHHIDGNSRNNENSNLLICPSQGYHLMLHVRERALAATGNPDMVPCHICKQWDLPENLYFRKSRPGQWHRRCSNILSRERAKRRAKRTHSF